jgi:serine/threonine protein kinase
MGMFLERLAERYTKEEELGEGGVGVAFKAEGIEDKKLYVIKIFDLDKIRNSIKEDTVRRLGMSKEAIASQILEAMLKNNKRIKEIMEERKGEEGWNNIKYIVEVGDENAPYVVTEYIRYNLREYMSIKGRIDPHQALRIVLDVATALKFVHESTKDSEHPIIAHTDVCPENIYIDVDERGEIKAVKLGDFDGAWTPGMSVELAMFHLDYKPPEAESEKFEPSEKFDVYSLGVILAELIGGEDAKKWVKKGIVIDKLREYEELLKKSVAFYKDRMTIDEFIEKVESISPVTVIIKKSIKELCEEWLNTLEYYKKHYKERPIPVLQENMLRSISSKFDELMDLWREKNFPRLKPLINEIREDLESLKEEMHGSTKSR